MTAGPDQGVTQQSPLAFGRNGETLHPTLVEGEVRVIGHRWSPRVHQIKAFLARSRVRYRWFDVERDEVAVGTAGHVGTGEQRYPIVILPDGSVLENDDGKIGRAHV